VTLDLVILGLTAVFALWGFFSGAARQLGAVIAGAVAWFASGPLGQFFGPVLTTRLSTSATVGVVLATLASFLVVVIFVQILATLILRRVLAGRDPDSRTLDRLLGFTLGGGKVLAVAYVALCAMSFLEQNVSLMGKKLAFTPKDSQLMRVVRQYNLLEYQQFSGARELMQIAKLTRDPKAQQRLKGDPDFAALSKDPRFARVLNAQGMQKALETGDVRHLLGSNEVVDLIHDPKALRQLERLGELSP
jgi:membrane protein required for colicin V production